MPAGKARMPASTAGASTAAPEVDATAQVSCTQRSRRRRVAATASTSPMDAPDAVVVSATGARKTSLLQSSVASSATNAQSNPARCSSATSGASWPRARSSIRRRMNGVRTTMWPGATRSASTEIVAGATRAWPKCRRSSSTCSMPLSSGMTSRGCGGSVTWRRLLSSCVALTAIQRTSTWRSSRSAGVTGAYADPNGLSSVSPGGCAAPEPGRVIMMTCRPPAASAAPTSPPTPPGPSTACRASVGFPGMPCAPHSGAGRR